MNYDFSSLKNKVEEINEWLVSEFKSIRTGRATPALLDSIQVDSYGALTPLGHIASISIDDARTLRITPFDNSQLKNIEKAITDANLGVSISADSSTLRIIFPELTADRRATLLKLAKDKLEEARVSLRQARDDVWKDIQAKEKDGEISEDEKFSAKEEMEKIIKDANEALDSLFGKKEQEIAE